MTQIVKQYNTMNDVFGQSQEYTVVRTEKSDEELIRKSKTLCIYPFKLLEYKYYNNYIPILTINKNVLGIEEALLSSYLKFLLYLMPELEKNLEDCDDIFDKRKIILENRIKYRNLIISLLSFVLRKKEDSIEIITLKQDQPFSKWKIKILIDDIYYTENDFTEIKNIILKQNAVPTASFEIYDAKLQQSLDKASAWMAKKNNSATLEEQIHAYHVETGISYAEISEYTFYQFKKSMDRAVISMDYKILRPLEASGQIEIKNGKIDHWLCHRPDTNKYGNIISEKRKLTKEIGDVSKIL